MDEHSTSTLSRRALLATTGALAAAAASRVALADQAHEGHGDSGVPKNAALHASALDCVRTGEDCLEHCIETFKAGDTALAKCAEQVRELTIACAALAGMAAVGSEHLALFARAAKAVCASCKAECDKHAHHKPCTDCGRSCAECIEQCDALGA